MSSRGIVVLTGAGISAESGLETFRDPDGVWSRHRLEDVATPEAFRRDPALVHGFYNMRRRRLLEPDVRPNAAHEALALLQSRLPGRVTLVTQNVDDLHDRAGSATVHMHGELLKIQCERCASVRPWRDDLSTATACPECGRTGALRPHVVWFGEMPFELERIGAALSRCGLFVAIGTSGNVQPAAGFVQEARWRAGARTVELNLERTGSSGMFDQSVQGPATDIVPAFVRSLLEAEAEGIR
ncbi:MAG: NAD-dependent deacylase [Candidatus Polarisedimenticolia bacterium]